jgi:hypothetical protein
MLETTGSPAEKNPIFSLSVSVGLGIQSPGCQQLI